MRLGAALIALLVIGCSSRPTVPDEPPGTSIVYSFEKFAPGTAPASFQFGAGGTHRPGKWEIVETAPAPSGRRVLAQRDSTPEDGRSPIAWIRDARFGDLRVSTVARAVSGSGFGLAWHIRDANNFLVCRLGAADGGFRVEAVVDGRLRELSSKPFILEPNRWYSLHVEQSGSRYRCGVDGHVLSEGEEPGPVKEGSVGVCTFNECTAQFDDLAVVGLTSGA